MAHSSDPIFSFAEGILTIFDGTHTNDPVWFGIINQHYFEGITGPTAFGTTFDRDLFIASDKLTGTGDNTTSHIKNSIQVDVDATAGNHKY